ncbi:MAG: penicillin acylase family protein, partial [Bdellovibrionales bacterium]|nr:penicillin acylase family protein [Bdellovibrionales bacterium]
AARLLAVLTSGRAARTITDEAAFRTRLRTARFQTAANVPALHFNASGLPEVSGEVSYGDIDRTMYLLGVPQQAEVEWRSLSPEQQAYLRSYVEGFNTCWRHVASAFEERFPWLNDIRGYQVTELDVLRRGIYFFRWGLVGTIRDALQALDESPGVTPDGLVMPVRDYDGASNQYVFSHEVTANGNPLLLADPHVPFKNTELQFDYLFVHAESPEFSFAGPVLTLLPAPILGAAYNATNNSCAWSLTSAGLDAFDVFSVPGNPEAGRYWSAGNPSGSLVEQQSYAVGRGLFQMRTTALGPVIAERPGRFVTVDWVERHSPGELAKWLFRMNTSAFNLAALEAALQRNGRPYGLGSLNVMATCNSRSATDPTPGYLYIPYGQVPQRGLTARDRDPSREFTNILDA